MPSNSNEPKRGQPDNNINELVDKYRQDVMLATQGLHSDNKTYKDSSVNVMALSTINFKSDLDQYYADFYRNKIIEEKVNLLEHLITSNPQYTHEAVKDILIDIKSKLTAQFNSKEEL